MLCLSHDNLMVWRKVSRIIRRRKHRARAKKEEALRKFREGKPVGYQHGSKMSSGFQSLLSYFSKKPKTKSEPNPPPAQPAKPPPRDDTGSSRFPEEGGSDPEEAREDKAFVRSTLRQSMKRWRKSLRRVEKKKRSENIQNSKLLTSGDREVEVDGQEDEFYDDAELDVVVVADGATEATPQTVTQGAPKIKRKPSLKRPAVSIKSSGFFSQSVVRGSVGASSSKSSVRPPSTSPDQSDYQQSKPASKRAETAIPRARKNKASALREEANRKKLGSGNPTAALPSAPAPSSSTSIPTPVDTVKRKTRASFRTKKGISRKPLIKKEIPRPSTAAAPVAVQENKASRLRAQKLAEQTAEKRARSSHSESRAEQARTKRVGSGSGRGPPGPDRSMSECAKSRVLPPPNFNPSHEPSPELQFIPLDSVSLPLDSDKAPIDQVKRKRRIERPVSNIFEKGSRDLPEKGTRRYAPSEEQTEFPVHYVVPPPPKTPSTTTTGPVRRALPVVKKADICLNSKSLVENYQHSRPSSTRSTSSSRSTPSSLTTSTPNKPVTRPANKLHSPTAPKPRQLGEVQASSTFVRQNSLDSSRRSKKGSPVAVARDLTSTSCRHSESSDQSASYDSDGSPGESPRFQGYSCSESLRFRSGSSPGMNISIDDLEKQRQSLRTPETKSGTIRVRGFRTRKSWIISDQPIEDSQEDKKLSEEDIDQESLLIEDITSGHADITTTLKSRTMVMQKLLAQMRSAPDLEKAARLSVSLSFPRTHEDSEFRTMRRVCQCAADDTALFQNCLGLLLTDRNAVSLPVCATLIGKVRYLLEIHDGGGGEVAHTKSDLLRGAAGDLLRHLTTTFGSKIAMRSSTPGMHFRLLEAAETCGKELHSLKGQIDDCVLADPSSDLLALKKTLELFNF